MTEGPRPGDEDARFHMKYDAWNHLVEVRADDDGEPGWAAAARRRKTRMSLITPYGDNQFALHGVAHLCVPWAGAG